MAGFTLLRPSSTWLRPARCCCGKLHEEFLTTTGLANPLNNSRRLGRGMAQHLKEAGVDAVILAST